MDFDVLLYLADLKQTMPVPTTWAAAWSAPTPESPTIQRVRKRALNSW